MLRAASAVMGLALDIVPLRRRGARRSARAAAFAASLLLALGPRGARGAERPRAAAPVRTLLLEPRALVGWLRARSPEVVAAAARVSQAESEVGAAALLPNPSLDLSLSNVTVGATNPPGLGFNDTVAYSVGVSETFELGKRGPRLAAARLRRRAAGSGYVDTLVQRAAEARLALGRVVYLQAKLRVLRESLDSARQALGLERTRMEQGNTSGNDYDRLALETLALGLDVERAGTEYAGALAACQAVLAAPCDPRDAREADLDTAAPVPAVPAAGDLDEVLARRPDLRGLELGRAAALADARLARRRLLPDPSLRLGFTYDRLTVAGNQPRGLMFTVTVPLPVFDRGQHDARRADARAAELRADLEAATLRARADVAGLQRRRAYLAAAVETLVTEAVPRSRAVLDTTTAAFARGQVSMTDLLLARRTHIGLLVTLMDVRFDYLQTRNELRRLLGLDAADAPEAAGKKVR